ncbi:DUF1561 family protein [Helicobacter sp. 11S03491-1]|uniref:DUF1561 family protein n=1 Tax=Helicobacter sp. 11S03491-1 TaxID=1476196 RepID=UPI000BA54217|nr:DUF1561 family protein [Helicobacter sp. 11S03491-1]PAF41191.1 hypothetical protein BKH45_08165 [Helicobacter sp. 11S03491-1]
MNQKILLCCLLSFVGLYGASVPQKLADKPADKPLRIITHNKQVYCYAPVISNGEHYVYIDNCNSSSVKPARYDVFQRISFNIYDSWFCVTAPSSVTGIDGKVTQKWDYVHLRPCAINDKNQRWIVKDNAFWTADGKFRLKDYGWYGYISQKASDYYNHTLDPSMQSWINTVATPGNISLKTPLAWTFKDSRQWGVYYIQDNYSTLDQIVNLYYNPENGHIAQYYPGNNTLFCMTSNNTSSQDWNWVSWNACSDIIPKTKDSMYWDISFMVENKGVLQDYQGNILRITKYGTNWGVPYTVKRSYLEKDTANTPDSLFLLAYDIGQWNQYVSANLGDTLEYCPAPGHKDSSAQRSKRSLPPTFRLTQEWIQRLWEIATTTDGGTTLISMCGTCLLHSYQMIAELQEYSISGPLRSGGYFFNTAPNTDPFDSFRQRFPILAQRLDSTIAFSNLPLRPQESGNTRTRRLGYAMSLSMLPQYAWHVSDLATTQDQIRDSIQELFNAPVGTLWFYIVSRSNAQGTGPVGHAQPILRTTDGLVFPTTNAPGMTLQQFTSRLNHLRSVDEVIDLLNIGGTRTLYLFLTLQVTGHHENPINASLSLNNCAGGGNNRRGNLRMPSSSLVNQCLSGRCSLQ